MAMKDIIQEKEEKEEAKPREKDSKKEQRPDPSSVYFAGVGRRKTAVSRARLFAVSEESQATILINEKPGDVYFPTASLRQIFLAPLQLLGLENRFRISVHVRGGGPVGQASATSLALSRALVTLNAEHRSLLKSGKFLSRDSRKVERKKPGLKKARRAPQWSKR